MILVIVGDTLPSQSSVAAECMITTTSSPVNFASAASITAISRPSFNEMTSSSDEASSFTQANSSFSTTSTVMTSVVAEVSQLSRQLTHLDNFSSLVTPSPLANSSTAGHSPSPLVNSSAAGPSPSPSPLANSLNQPTACRLVYSSATGPSPSPLANSLNQPTACRLVYSSATGPSPSPLANSLNQPTACRLVYSSATGHSPSPLANSSTAGHSPSPLVNSSAAGPSPSPLANSLNQPTAYRLVYSSATGHSPSPLANSSTAGSSPSPLANSLNAGLSPSPLANSSATGHSPSPLANSLTAGHPPSVLVNILHQPTASTALLPQCDPLAELKHAVAGGNLLNIGKAILQNKQLTDVVIKLIAGVVDSECSVLCRRNNASLFRKTSVTTMPTFQWSQLVDELATNAPTLLCLLTAIVTQ